MAKPVLKKITPFDATKDYTVSFAWNGNRSYSNRIIIYRNENLDVVYDHTVTTFKLEQTIPANTLVNGKKYIIKCQSFDHEGVESPLSEGVLFYTFATPDFLFSNLTEIITNASYNATIYYYSPDFEDIDSYKFYLYDSTKRQLLESNSLYDDVDISYTYRGLESNTHYYIRCIGVTINGMALDTGYIEIYVTYENPGTYSRLYAVNKPEQGCISLETNLIIIQYNGTEEFEYKDGMINLIDKTLVYDEGFLIENDFTLILRGLHLWGTREILRMQNENHGLSLSSHIYGDGKLRFKLKVPNGVSNYILYSEPLQFTDKDMITICLRRINHVYQLKTFFKVNFVPEGNYWFGRTKPKLNVEKYDTWFVTDETLTKVLKEDMTIFTGDDDVSNAKKHDIWIGGV